MDNDIHNADQTARGLWVRTIVGLLGVLGAMTVASMLAREPLEKAGSWFIDQLGMPGVFAGTFLCDTFNLPMPPDVFLMAAVVGLKSSPVGVVAVMCVASMLGGQAAYFLGGRFERWEWLRIKLKPLRAKGEQLFERWGTAVVFVAALTPLPFAVVCWAAGMFEMSWARFSFATIFRIPRFILAYAVLALGWMAGGAVS